MSRFIARIAAAAIAVTAASVFAVGVTYAASPSTRIVLGDIDFSRADGVALFNARVEAVQRRLCVAGPKRSVAESAACGEAVRAEIVAHLTRQQRIALGEAAATRG